MKKSAASEQAISSPDLERIPDIFGFETQQAAEKLLKALLIEIGIRYRRTHDLAELVQLVQLHDQPIPPTPIVLSRLTAFAVQFRYEELPGDLALVPAEARDTVAILRKHVESRIEQIAATRRG